jgi:hypothetical protein
MYPGNMANALQQLLSTYTSSVAQKTDVSLILAAASTL